MIKEPLQKRKAETHFTFKFRLQTLHFHSPKDEIFELDFIFSAFRKFSYRNKFIHMIQVAWTNIQSKIKINGLLSDSFTLIQGFRQCCPLYVVMRYCGWVTSNFHWCPYKNQRYTDGKPWNWNSKFCWWHYIFLKRL